MKKLLFFFSALFYISSYAQKTQSYDEIVISSSPKEEIVFKDSKFYVTDFSVSEEGTFVLVNRFKNNFVYLLDDFHKKKSELELDFKPNKLFEDCLGAIHVIGNEKAIQIWIDSTDNIQFTEIPKILYDEFYYKCVGTSRDFVFFSHYDNFNQGILYYGIEKHTQRPKHLYRIYSESQARELTEEYSMIFGANSDEHLAEINSDELRSQRNLIDRYFFFINVLTKPTYNPLISHKDTSMIFDHLNGKVVKLDACGTQIESYDIEYHKTQNWQQKIVFDSKREKFYSVMGKGGSKNLMELSESFKQKNTFELVRNQAIDKITIYDGYAYYLGKEDNGEILNKLYRIRVRT